MALFAKLFSFLSISAGAQNSKETIIFYFDEPECPRDLLK